MNPPLKELLFLLLPRSPTPFTVIILFIRYHFILCIISNLYFFIFVFLFVFLFVFITFPTITNEKIFIINLTCYYKLNFFLCVPHPSQPVTHFEIYLWPTIFQRWHQRFLPRTTREWCLSVAKTKICDLSVLHFSVDWNWTFTKTNFICCRTWRFHGPRKMSKLRFLLLT